MSMFGFSSGDPATPNTHTKQLSFLVMMVAFLLVLFQHVREIVSSDFTVLSHILLSFLFSRATPFAGVSVLQTIYKKEACSFALLLHEPDERYMNEQCSRVEQLNSVLFCG